MKNEVNFMFTKVMNALGDFYEVSVIGDTQFESVNKENIDAFAKVCNAGKYDNCQIKMDYDDEESELVVAFLGLNNKEGEVKMINTNEVKVENKTMKGDVKMENKKVFVDTKFLVLVRNNMEKTLEPKFSFNGSINEAEQMVVEGRFYTNKGYVNYKYVSGFTGITSFRLRVGKNKISVEPKAKVVAKEIERLLSERSVNINKTEGDVKMVNRRALDFVMAVEAMQGLGKAPKINVIVEGVSTELAVTFSNFNKYNKAVENGHWDTLVKTANQGMASTHFIKDGVFNLVLSNGEVAPVTSEAIKMPISHLDEEARKEEQEKADAIIDSIKTIEESILGDDTEDVTPTTIMPYPNMDILHEDFSTNKEKTEKLKKTAPVTGIDTKGKFQQKLINKVIAPAFGAKIKTKIQTAQMQFLDYKEYTKSCGTLGSQYKAVSIAWIFKLLDIRNFIIVNNVPNENSLRRALSKGIIANVKVGQKPTGKFDQEGKEIMEDVFEERLFQYVATSASKQRQERYIFTCYADRENIRKMLVFWSDEFDFGTEISIAKAESRIGQNLSTGVCVGGAAPYAKKDFYANHPYGRFIEFYYVVIPDMTVAEFKKSIGMTPEPGDEDQILGDGSGFETPAVSLLMGKKLKKNAVMPQHRLGKGTTPELTIGECETYCKNHGLDIDCNLPVVFISKSMWKFNSGIDILPFVVLRTSEEMAEKAAMCYETWNALNISSPQGLRTIEELANEEFDFFKLGVDSDPGLISHRLGTVAKLKDIDNDIYEDDADDYDLSEDKRLATALFRFFSVNAYYARRSEYLMKKVRELFERKIADMARGRILVNGSFCIMMIDPGIWTGNPILKAGQVYVGGKIGDCLCARFPMVTPSEPQKMEAVNCPEFARFKGKNVIIFNAFDYAWEAMQGADFDGDTCLVIFDKRVIELKVNTFPVITMEKKSANGVTLSWDSITEYFCTNFRNAHPKDNRDVATIGKTNNIVAALLSIAHANGTFLSQETIDRISELAVAINDLIDAAKTGVGAELDPWYFKNFRLLPNWLAKSYKDGRRFVNSWEIPTNDNDPESKYYLDKVSPLGKLANEIVPKLFADFNVVGDTNFNTNDMVGHYSSAAIVIVEGQAKGIESLYSKGARAIFKQQGVSEAAKTTEFQSLVEECNTKLRKVAATYDILTTAVACLRVGRSNGFAFKCFEEGVLALFESLKGIRYTKMSAGMTMPEGAVRKVFDGIEYYATMREGRENQINKFVKAAESISKEVTIRIVGLQFSGVKSMNDLKAKIAASNNIIHGGRSASGFSAFAGTAAIGKITLEREFCASSEFAEGGYALVKDVNFVKSTSDKAMDPKVYAAKLDFNAPIKYADITVEYTGRPVDDNSSESTENAQDFAAMDSTFVLPSAFGVTSDAGVSTPASTPSSLVGGLNEMFGNNLEASKDNSMPDYMFASSNGPEIDDDYMQALYADVDSWQ